MQPSLIKVEDILYVAYECPDLDKIEDFMCDFGLVVSNKTNQSLFMRGSAGNHHVYVARKSEKTGLQAIAFKASSRGDLELLASHFPDAKIESVDDPGGGEKVRLIDPNGFCIDVIHGMERVAPLETDELYSSNFPREKNRLDTPYRIKDFPPKIERLGHVGLSVSSFSKTFEFYNSILGMLASDILYDGNSENSVGGFIRCNREEKWVDHHTLALFENPNRTSVHHASFEMHAIDSVMLSHEWLLSKKWEPYWGTGRHVLGSQVFDYWRDPYGNLVEHYADGDVCNSKTSCGQYQRSSDLRKMWGPAVPNDFMK